MEAELITVTDEDVKSFIQDETKKKEFARFIHDRLFYRYINPFKYKSKTTIRKKGNSKEFNEFTLMYKNGFSIMANSCLLIETLESFYRGWGMTRGSNEKAFLKFFGRDNNFSEFATDDMATEFYKNIRCAILHQGETSGGWSISREGSYLIDKKNKKINAFKFITLLEKTLNEYEIKLNNSDWNDEIWINARKKIKSILKNIK